MVGGRGGSIVRRSAATALGVYGRAVLSVAQIVAPAGDTQGQALPGRTSSGRRADPTGPRRLDARTADITDVRRLALDASIAATADPSRSATDRFADRVDGLSDWGSGRLLQETERMRQAAVAVIAAGTGDGRVLQRRQFDPTLRRQFPWLDDATASRLYDHAVLVAHRIRQTPPSTAQAEPGSGPGLFGSLVSRLRSR